MNCAKPAHPSLVHCLLPQVDVDQKLEIEANFLQWLCWIFVMTICMHLRTHVEFYFHWMVYIIVNLPKGQPPGLLIQIKHRRIRRLALVESKEFIMKEKELRYCRDCQKVEKPKCEWLAPSSVASDCCSMFPAAAHAPPPKIESGMWRVCV
jgi:hypothetical protein